MESPSNRDQQLIFLQFLGLSECITPPEPSSCSNSPRKPLPSVRYGKTRLWHSTFDCRVRLSRTPTSTPASSPVKAGRRSNRRLPANNSEVVDCLLDSVRVKLMDVKSFIDNNRNVVPGIASKEDTITNKHIRLSISKEDAVAGLQPLSRLPLSVDLSSELGRRLVKLTAKRQQGCNGCIVGADQPPSTWYELFCTGRSVSPALLAFSDHVETRRSQSSDFAVTYVPLRNHQESIRYRFTRRERREFCRTFDTGLNGRSRALRRLVCPCSVRLNRLSDRIVAKLLTVPRHNQKHSSATAIPEFSSPGPVLRNICCTCNCLYRVFGARLVANRKHNASCPISFRTTQSLPKPDIVTGKPCSVSITRLPDQSVTNLPCERNKSDGKQLNLELVTGFTELPILDTAAVNIPEPLTPTSCSSSELCDLSSSSKSFQRWNDDTDTLRSNLPRGSASDTAILVKPCSVVLSRSSQDLRTVRRKAAKCPSIKRLAVKQGSSLKLISRCRSQVKLDAAFKGSLLKSYPVVMLETVTDLYGLPMTPQSLNSENS